MDGDPADPLGEVRAAIARQDWQAAFDGARAVEADGPAVVAERADLEATAAWWLGRLTDCIAARELAHRTYDDLGDHRRAGQCAVWLWEHNSILVRPSIAGGWLRRARRALDEDRGCVEYGALVLREAETAHGLGDLERALALDDEAIELGRSLRSADIEAEGLQAKGRVLIDRGDLVEGMGHLDEAMLFAVEGRLGPYSTGKVYCSLISACEQAGDHDRAAEWTEATLHWAEKHHPLAIFPGICRVHRAIVLKRRGALAEAEREAQRACDELLQSHVGNSAAAYAEVGDIRRRLGQLDRAEEAFSRSQELRGGPCAGLSLLRLAQGRVDAARSLIEDCLRGTTGSRLGRSGLLATLVHVAIADHDLVTADAAAAELDEIAGHYAIPDLRATALSTRGRLLLAHRDPDAVTILQQAVEAWAALEVPYEVATARTLLGEARRAAGEEAAAKESFAIAAELFDRIGAHLDAEMILGGARVANPMGLTEREIEILRLTAAGLTNNEIASSVQLSAKTVSRHLSNIFTKIGVSTRAAATAFAFEHDLVDPRR